MKALTNTLGRDGHVGQPATIGIVTVSDRASEGTYQDEGGPAILAQVQARARFTIGVSPMSVRTSQRP